MPFGADTPTPEFVGNSRVRGARSPPGTHRDLTTPSAGTLWAAAGKPTRTVDFSGVKRRSVRRAVFRRARRAKPTGSVDFSGAKRRSVPARRTSPEQSGEVCSPADFRRAKSESVPARRFTRAKSESGTGRRVCPAGEKNPVFRKLFFAAYAHI